MNRPILVFAATLLAFLAMDALWISLVALELFRSNVGPIMRPTPQIAPVLLFYLLYPVGLMVLAIRPAVRDGALSVAAINGLVLGLVSYATFDLTNWSILQGWSATLAAIDIAWGATLSSLSAIAGYLVAVRVLR